MTKFLYAITLFSSVLLTFSANAKSRVVLTGKGLTVNEVITVARHNVMVKIDPGAYQRVKKSHQLLLLGVARGIPVYGITTGVADDKERKIFVGDSLDPEARRLSEEFNANLIRNTAAGVGPPLSVEIVRAIMLLRANALALGTPAARTRVLEMLVKFLNRKIHPVVPSRGTMGEADVTLLSHIALAMMGEGEVFYKGKRQKAANVLRINRIKPLVPFGKDAVAIKSSNAHSAALAVFVVHEARRLLDAADLVFALSLEGLNGNVAPILAAVHRVRPFRGSAETAKRIRSILAGSYLWKRSPNRILQDPLSYRTASYVHGAARDALRNLAAELRIQLNSSDDNPGVILGIDPPADAGSQEKYYYVAKGSLKGAIIPTANFDPIPWVLSIQKLALALAHISRATVHRMMKLREKRFTGLPKYLSLQKNTVAIAYSQYAYGALDGEVQALAHPVSTDLAAIADGVEDVATNSSYAVSRCREIIDTVYRLVGMELLHAAQAIDLRKKLQRSLRLGTKTRRLYTRYRKIVPVIKKDRVLTKDFELSYNFVKAL